LERGHLADVIRKMALSKSMTSSRRILRREVVLTKLMTDDELDKLIGRMNKIPPPSGGQLVSWRDGLAALQIFGLVFLCTIPVALPFAIMDNIAFAVRVSNGIALLFLLIGGFLLAGYAGFRRIPTALGYAFVGVLLIVVTMALGG